METRPAEARHRNGRGAGGRGDAESAGFDRRTGVAAAVVSALAFSTEGLFAVVAFQRGADAAAALVVRFAIAVGYALMWLLWLRVRPTGISPTGISPAGARPAAAGQPPGAIRARDLRLVFAAGMLAHGAIPRLLFESFALIPTWLALLLFYLFPVLVTVGEHILGRQRLRPGRMLTVGMTLAGAALVANPATGAGIHPLGVLLALGAAVGNAVFLLAMDPILRRVPVPDAVAVQFGGGIVAQTVLLVAGGAAGARLAAALPAWPWLLALGVITSGVAVTCLNVGVQRIGAARTAIIGMLEPVFAVVWGVALLGEAFGPLQGLGAAVVIAGVAGSIRNG